MIVVSVPERNGELREGTLLKTKMMDTLSTSSTVQGTKIHGSGDGADREEWPGDYSGWLAFWRGE